MYSFGIFGNCRLNMFFKAIKSTRLSSFPSLITTSKVTSDGMVTPGTPTWAVYSVDVPISIDTGRADDDDEDDEVELDDAGEGEAGDERGRREGRLEPLDHVRDLELPQILQVVPQLRVEEQFIGREHGGLA